MAYQLSTDRTGQAKSVPADCATDMVFAYPQASSLNQCCRPSTMLYGTAPYMAGKGAPAEFVDTADRLRPQSTTRFGKVIVPTHERNFFPLNNMVCSQPLRTISYNPSSTRSDLQNGLFTKRYCKR
jgi:hypothetical protein